MEFLRNIFLNSTLKSNANKNGKQFLNWENITTIYILIDEPQIDKHKLDKLFSSLNKHIESGYVNINSKTATFSDWHCFTKNESNFLNLPNSKAFIPNTDFDLLINTCKPTNHYATSISATVAAKLKCSGFDEANLYNLVIKKDSLSLIAYIESVVNYLKMIKPN